MGKKLPLHNVKRHRWVMAEYIDARLHDGRIDAEEYVLSHWTNGAPSEDCPKTTALHLELRNGQTVMVYRKQTLINEKESRAYCDSLGRDEKRIAEYG